MKKLFPIIIFILFGCADSILMKEHKIGDIYRNIGDLYIVGDYLYFDSWFTDMREDRKKFYKFKKGTLFELVYIKYNKKSSWNTGTYYYHSGKIKVLTGEKKGNIYEAIHIMTDSQFGIDEKKMILEKK